MTEEGNTILKKLIRACGREINSSKTLICRMTSQHGMYWINILSQITIQNELTPSFKNALKPLGQKIRKYIVKNRELTPDNPEFISKIIKEEIGEKTSYILTFLYKIIKNSLSLNSGQSIETLEKMKEELEKINQTLNLQLLI